MIIFISVYSYNFIFFFIYKITNLMMFIHLLFILYIREAIGVQVFVNPESGASQYSSVIYCLLYIMYSIFFNLFSNTTLRVA